MTGLEYVNGVLKKYAVDPNKAVQYHTLFLPYIMEWANGYLIDVKVSGSSAKGTAVSSGTDVDLFISLTSTTKNTLNEIYESLFSYMGGKGFTARRQNVSIGINHNLNKIDLVPGRRQNQYGNDHSLYVSKKNSWTKTNISTHIYQVSNSSRLNEIKLAKIWRNANNLDFPSFYLELIIMDALYNKTVGAIDTNFVAALSFIASNIESNSYFDPSNTNNCISDQISAVEKKRIATVAKNSASQKFWKYVVA
ncbi:hypothetical protein ABA45_14655 [Marinobacter psychrophilus]|jgi:hypothetical protein|uniref:Nucleotidyltransferase n=1 Tax=Marinobacter psychrophilus TaxID=330734 RepID=A0A0H4I375_9GAMM|nr:hypothetical protein [Marinobacter psychrophilus]AKO53501.1 hypothetical protein ABA45_14655 [Marinobacter psychrophilus]